MDRSVLSWDFIAILAALGVLVPWRGRARVRDLMSRTSLGTGDRLSIYGSTMAFQWIATMVTAWLCYRHGWSAMGLGLVVDRPTRDILIGAALAAVLAGVQLLSLRQVADIPAEKRGFIQDMAKKMLPQNLLEALPFVALVCTVSVCEEFLFRGFVYEFFLRLFGGFVFAALLASAVMFGIAHLYQGHRGIIATFLLGLVFGAVRIWTGSLVPSVISHFTVDIMAGLVAPRTLLRTGGAEAGEGDSAAILYIDINL